jgi:hypothetical protein
VRDPGIRARAEARFAGLRQRALNGVPPDAAAAVPPGGWCIAAVARISQNGREVLPRLADLQRRLAPLGRLYAYPEPSWHISLLGCTQREAVPPSESPARVAVIRDALARVTAGAPAVRADLGAVSLTGAQLFVEVLTDDPGWSRLRAELAAALRQAGENPLAYPDPEPMHLNVARLLAAPDPGRLQQALLDRDLAVGRPVRLQVIELVLTDFLLTPATLRVLGVVTLGAGPQGAR